MLFSEINQKKFLISLIIKKKKRNFLLSYNLQRSQMKRSWPLLAYSSGNKAIESSGRSVIITRLFLGL